MARSFQEIRDAIVAEKETKPELDVINLDSQVSETGLWVDVTAEAIRVTETFLDISNADIQAKIDSQITGTALWLQTECYKFQLGDELLDDGTYAVINPVKQIITRCAVVEEMDGSVTIKVAKGEIGSESALTSGELNQFTTYVQRIKFAGTLINVISLNADQLKLTATIYHDGIYSTAVMQDRVQIALENYMVNKLTFNGTVLVNQIINELQNVEGLIDIEITDIRAIVGVDETVFTRNYQTSSGYVKESEDFPFIDTITYVAQVSNN